MSLRQMLPLLLPLLPEAQLQLGLLLAMLPLQQLQLATVLLLEPLQGATDISLSFSRPPS